MRICYAVGRRCNHIRFNFDEAKAVETLAYVAQAWPGITPFYVSKVMFIADRDHLRTYGRPVTGDAYIAMANGPVPSRIYDIIKGDLDFFGAPAAIVEALTIEQTGKYHELRAKRAPNTDLLSETDIVALDDAIKFCRGRSVPELSNLTHQEPAWFQAPANDEMDLELLVPEEMGTGSRGLRDPVITGHVYRIYTTLVNTPKTKIVLCVGGGFFLWFNTKPHPQWPGQMQVCTAEAPGITKDCYLNYGRITVFRPSELADAQDQGACTRDFLLRVIDEVENRALTLVTLHRRQVA